MDTHLIEIIVTVVCSVMASSGFWAVVQHFLNKNSSQDKLLLGIAHDRIMFLSRQYIKRGYITPDEYENLIEYLYEPYLKFGGNGTVKHMVEGNIVHLPIKPHETTI